MYYLLHRNQLHVSALFIGHLQVDNEKHTQIECNCLLSFSLSNWRWPM